MHDQVKTKNMKNFSYQDEQESKPFSLVWMTLFLLAVSAIVTTVLIQVLEWISY